MSLFKCSRCGTIDNTGMTPGFWIRVCKKLDPLCTECNTGKWHDVFPKEAFDPATHFIDDVGHVGYMPDPEPANDRPGSADKNTEVLNHETFKSPMPRLLRPDKSG